MANPDPSPSRTSVWAALHDGRDRIVTRLLYASVAASPLIVALRQVREPFDAASDISVVTMDLAVAYIAGWIFYFLTVWRPRAVDRDKVMMLVARDSLWLTGAAKGFVDHLRHASNGALPEGPLTRDQFASVVGLLSPSTSANMINLAGGRVSLADALDDAWRRPEECAAKLERWAELVSIDLLVCVHRVLDAQIGTPTLMSILHAQQGTFGGLTGLLADWFEASGALALHVATELAEDASRAG